MPPASKPSPDKKGGPKAPAKKQDSAGPAKKEKKEPTAEEPSKKVEPPATVDISDATPTPEKKAEPAASDKKPSPDKKPAAAKAGSTSKASPSKPAGTSKAAPSERKGAGASASKAAGSKAASSKGGGKGKGVEEKETAPLRSSSDLNAAAEALLTEAASIEKAAETGFGTFEYKLGEAILKRVQQLGKLEDMVREWDSNGDGDISKIEFRQCVRAKLKLAADNKDIDAFFSKMDSDGGGSLDLSEMKPSLKKLKDDAASAEGVAEQQRQRATAMKAKAATTQETAKATEAMEKEEARLYALQNDLSVSARLGAAIVKRNMKIGDVVSKWDKDGDGTVDKKEFVDDVLALGVQAEKAAIAELFDELDEDHGGTLDLAELKTTLKKLIDSATASDLEVKDLKTSAAKLRKDATKMQKDLVAAQAKEDKEAKEAEEAAAKAAEEKKAADAAAKEAAKAAKAEKEAAKAAEKAAFDEKIAARRKGPAATKGS